MQEYIPSIGDQVYIYSTILNEVIEGTVEGYADDSYRRVKILQSLSFGEDTALRHIVSYVYVFQTFKEAQQYKEEYVNLSERIIKVGNIVSVLDTRGYPLLNHQSVPYSYQVVAVYKDAEKVGLVTSYGEYVGTYDIRKVQYVSEGPIFKKEDYEVGTPVVWVDKEDVYEGAISTLYETSAKVINIKKLLPVNKSMRIPYWKIPEGRKSIEEDTIQVLHTIIGDDLD